MVKNTKAASQKAPNRFYLILFFLLFLSKQTFAYTDQVVIETPNTVKTIYDVRVHAFIRHLYDDKKIVDTSTNEWIKSFQEECDNFIQQLLAQNYAAENVNDLKPSDSEIKEVVDKINSSLKDLVIKKKYFDILSMTDNDVEQWAVNRIIFDKFLFNTIQNRVIITDEKVLTHYKTWKAERFGNKPLEQITQKVRDDLIQSLRKEEFKKWVDQEKRRQKMIVKVVAVL